MGKGNVTSTPAEREGKDQATRNKCGVSAVMAGPSTVASLEENVGKRVSRSHRGWQPGKGVVNGQSASRSKVRKGCDGEGRKPQARQNETEGGGC